MAVALARTVAIRRAALVLPRAFSSTSIASAGPAASVGGINSPDVRSPYGDENVEPQADTSLRSRLSQVPGLGRMFGKKPAAAPKPDPVPWVAKPRANGVYYHKLKPWSSSPNIAVNRYNVAETLAPPVSGIRNRWSQYMKDARTASTSAVAVGALRKALPGYAPDKLEQLAAEIYHMVNSSFYSRKVAVLRQLCTEKVYSRLKHDMKARLGSSKRPSGVTIDWSLDEFVTRPSIVQTRTFPIRDDTDLWAQITVKFHSIQSLTISGDDARPEVVGRRLPVVEYWVLERSLNVKSALWRVCDKLQIVDGATGGISAGKVSQPLVKPSAPAPTASA
eukprot:c56097_g1_i1.p1 GENE.c56097_g1_i1~~c56097_g1_i1.p1  ORF type:complete len:335 (+),score=47.72 c56097_g1_i1:35-1039(+)